MEQEIAVVREQTAELNSPVERVWKPNLYNLQQESPKPHPVLCSHLTDSPLTRTYGFEFHGSISHAEASRLLLIEGAYLIRTSGNGQATLSLRFSGTIKHYRLFRDQKDGSHYVKEKRFASVRDLVADGLVTMYIEKEAGGYLEKMYAQSNYEQSPYMTLNRLKRKALKRESDKQKQQQEAAALETNTTPTNNNIGEARRETYDKAHAFRVHTFKGLNWCDYCGNFLWGFTAQGVKCDDCGFSAHVKCAERVPSDCCPELQRGVFGTDLTTLSKAHRSARPFVLDKCIQEIESRGLADAEGLYRVPGFADHVENLKMTLDRDGEHAEMGPNIYDNVNVIAGTLKLFLRLLPIPVVSFEAHPLLCKAAEIRSLPEKIAAIRSAVSVLPLAHYHTLKYLVEHLARVADHAESNKMSAHNLATVFAPTLMPALEPPSLTSQGGMPGMAAEICALEAMILHHQHIFQ